MLLKKATTKENAFKNATKMLKKQICEQKSSCDIFKSMSNMNVRVSGYQKTSHGLTLKRLPDPQPTQQRPPAPFNNSCLFWRCFELFLRTT